MIFSALKTELSDRGFSYLSDTRLGYYINRARARLDAMYCWPYTEDSGQGVAPLSVSTLRIVEAVTNETQDYMLEQSSYRELVDYYGDLSTTGTPAFWYRAYISGNPVISTYPTSADTIGVQFWKVTADLSAASDAPAAPSRFHLLIVDMAQQMAYRDSDNHQAAEAMQAEINRELYEMMEDLLPQQEPRATLYHPWAHADS